MAHEKLVSASLETSESQTATEINFLSQKFNQNFNTQLHFASLSSAVRADQTWIKDITRDESKYYLHHSIVK